MNIHDTPARNTRLRKRIAESTPIGSEPPIQGLSSNDIAPSALDTNYTPVVDDIPNQPKSIQETSSFIAPINAAKELNPKTTQLEFGGVLGTFALLLGMPATVLVMNRLCSCADLSMDIILNCLTGDLSTVFNLTGLVMYTLWIGWCYALYFILPGEYVPGTKLRNGLTLQYKLNAFSTFVVTHLSLGVLVYYHNLSPLLFIADHFMSLAGASILFTYTLSYYVYASSFRGPDASGHEIKLLATGGNSGHLVYDFFMGRELNPQFGSLDLKSFFELRPGLIGWNVINIAFLAKQYHLYGTITNNMIMTFLFQGLFIADAVFHEKKVLSTMDITTDGFGYMLIAGDAMWVPFLYSLQAHYLSVNPHGLSLAWMLFVFGLNFTGYYIFRASNSEKDLFKSNPNHVKFADARVIITRSGSLLLADGWWAKARHINYLGDWLMSLAWSVACGFAHPVPYFYPIYFAVLLVHRFYRDEHKCQNKYGDDWKLYCTYVPHRIIPHIW